MGHYGKHIIDPQTGLCEICDKNAIQEIRQGRVAQQPIYPNNSAIPFEQESYVYPNNGEATGSYIRRSAVPPPSAFSPRVIYEDTNVGPPMTQRIIRQGYTPTQGFINQPYPRSPMIYPQYNQSSPRRPVRVVSQYAQTPPPPASQIWNTGPRRKINSGMVMAQRPAAVGGGPVYYRRATPNDLGGHYTPRVYTGQGISRQVRLPPLQQSAYAEPSAVRNVYRKLPPGPYGTLAPSSYNYQPQTILQTLPEQPQQPQQPQQPIVYNLRLVDP